MPTFRYIDARSLDEAVALLADGGLPVGGGTDLLPQVRDGVTQTQLLVGLAAVLGLGEISGSADGGLSIGAAASIADVAAHPLVRGSYAVLAEAAGGLATPQIRNEATLGGNLAQRPRCWYFRSPLVPCLKKGGDRCYALAGTTRHLCVTGGDRCYIVHPSDTGMALMALDARIETVSPNGGRTLAAGDFFAGPGRDLLRENVLEQGEIIARVTLPAPEPDRSAYLKVRERESGDFALVSVAAALWLEDTPAGPAVREARVALGGVAPVPHRALEVEQYLTGQATPAIDATHAGSLALPNPTPLPENAYKIPMARNMVQRAIAQLTAQLTREG